MDKEYKVVLVNTKDPDGEKILNESKHVVRQVPDDYFKFQSVGQHDFCHISLSGQLADDPAFYFRKRDRNSKRQGDNFTDPSVFVNLNIICTLRTYHDKYGQLKEVTSNISARSFREYDKRALALYHKGDRVTVEGSLRTYSAKDASKNWFYVEINSFTVNPYKTFSKMASSAFDTHEPIRRTNDILADYRISNDEKKAQLKWTNLQKDRKLKEQQEQIAHLKEALSNSQKEQIMNDDKQTDSFEAEPMMEDPVNGSPNQNRAVLNEEYQNKPVVPFDKIEMTDETKSGAMNDNDNLNSLETSTIGTSQNMENLSRTKISSNKDEMNNQSATKHSTQNKLNSNTDDKPVTTEELNDALESVFW